MTSPPPLNKFYSDKLLGPVAAQQIVDESGNVGDGNIILEVAVCVLEADASSITTQQVVDEGGNISDSNILAHVHVTTQAGGNNRICIQGGELNDVTPVALEVSIVSSWDQSVH